MMRGFHAPWPAAALALLAIFMVNACSDDPGEPAPKPVGTYLDKVGCLDKDAAEDPPAVPRDRGFIFWSYDSGTLSLDHENAGLNCCTEFTATIVVRNDSLQIVESELGGDCDCLCLYRIGFEVSNLPVGIYQLTVDEEYLAPLDPPLVGAIDLTQAEFGTIQAPRSRYPWGKGVEFSASGGEGGP